MTSIIFMFLAHLVSIWNPTENFISEYWQWQTWQCHTLSAPHTPAHSIFFLSLGLNICLMDVCDDLFGLWSGLWRFVMWFVVFSATLFDEQFVRYTPLEKLSSNFVVNSTYEMDAQTNIWTERQKLYTARHKCRGVNTHLKAKLNEKRTITNAY